ERELAPLIRSTYTNDDGNNPAWNILYPILPFAAPFGSPATAGVFMGATGTYRGLLPFMRTYTPCGCSALSCECNAPPSIPPAPPPPNLPPALCTAGPADCDPTAPPFRSPDPAMSGSNFFNVSCSRTGSNTQITCTFNVRQPVSGGPVNQPFTLSSITVRDVGGSLKRFQPEAPMP